MDRPLKDILLCNTIEDSKVCISSILKLYFRLISTSHSYTCTNQAEADCIMSMQMMFTRGCSFVQLLDGFNYQDGEEVLNRIIDPSVLYSLVRDVYESLCSFELVYILPDTGEKKELAYNMYLISGLRERQNYDIRTQDASQLKADELKEINEANDKIKQLGYYRNLSRKDQNYIQAKIASPHPRYRMLYSDDALTHNVEWENAYRLIGIKEEVLKDMYNFLSAHAHPTAISLRQFRDSFLLNDPHFIEAACMASKTMAMLLSIYIVDFCKKFAFAKGEFDKIDEYIQWLIDKNNVTFRGYEYALSDKWENIKNE